MILHADAAHIPLADNSVHCVVTSPPYWGLRQYPVPSTIWEDGWTGQLGLEPTPELYVDHLVQVFREVRRVLRLDGTCWLNLGDSFYNGGSGGTSGGKNVGATVAGYRRQVPDSKNAKAGIPAYGPNRTPLEGLKDKDLVGIPWMVAFALRADGWWLRRDVVWAKGLSFCPDWSGSVMPESIRDRPTKSAHEYLFLLAKSPRYYYDIDAVREPHASSTYARLAQRTFDQQTGGPKDGLNPNRSARKAVENLRARLKTVETPHAGGRRQAPEPSEPGAFHIAGRNLRSVWALNPEPYPDAHFAVMPTGLVTPCVMAGTSEGGVCAACGAPWVREVVREVPEDPGISPEAKRGTVAGLLGRAHDQHRRLGQAYQDQLDAAPATMRGWRPGCGCSMGPGLELEPDDLEVVESPAGAGGGEPDPTLEEGRRGLGRPRRLDEGTRPMTRYEQRRYARQLRESAHLGAMEEQAGAEALAHYLRTDRAGARPIPPDLLAEWLECGWLEPVEVPTTTPPPTTQPVVLDPFAGSGTVGEVCHRLGRRFVGLDLAGEYVGQAKRRTAQLGLI